jgi:hypothetical protein
MRIALIALAGSALAACAASAPAPPASNVAAVAVAPPSCFRSMDIQGHKKVDDNTMYIGVRHDSVYRIGMRNSCLAGAWESDPIITRQPPGASYICRPIDMDVSIAHLPAGYDVKCIVDSIALLTPAEVEALPRRLRP